MSRREPFFLSVEHVLAIHCYLVEKFGGDGSIRDRGLLASAVAMPAASYGGVYLHENLEEMAAAYMFHLCKNHAFVDGNKRVAWGAAEVFIQLNGKRVNVTNDEVVEFTLGVAKGETSKAEVIAFFTLHTVSE